MRFLQFSDIHFTRAGEDDVFHLDRELQWGVRAVLLELAPIDGIVVCGDVAFSGKPSEYSVAEKFLRDVCARLRIPPEMVFVIPGNHDIDRDVTNTNPQRALRAGLRNTTDSQEMNRRLGAACGDAGDGALLMEPLRAYNAFAAQYHCRTLAARPCWDHVIDLDARHGLALRGLNSVLVSYQHDNDSDERLVVGTGQCILEPESTDLYMTLCHHPREWLLDGNELRKRLDKAVALQVTGHVHEHRVERTTRGLLLRAGALQPSRREQDWLPQFAVVEIELDDSQAKISIEPWRWDEDEVEFVAQPPHVDSVRLPPEELAPEAIATIKASAHRRRLVHDVAQLSISDALLAVEASGGAASVADEVDETELADAIVRSAEAGERLAELWDAVQDAQGTRSQRDRPDNPFR